MSVADGVIVTAVPTRSDVGAVQLTDGAVRSTMIAVLSEATSSLPRRHSITTPCIPFAQEGGVGRDLD